MYIGLHVKYPLFLSNFNEIWIFVADFKKNTQVSNFGKIRPLGAELFHVDGRTNGQTDMTKVIEAFLNFVNAPKDWQRIISLQRFGRWHFECVEKFNILFHSTCNSFIRDKNIFTFFLPWICMSILSFLSPFSSGGPLALLLVSSFFFQQFSSQMNIPVWGRQSMLGLKFPFATPAITPHPLQTLFLPLYFPRIIKANE